MSNQDNRERKKIEINPDLFKVGSKKGSSKKSVTAKKRTNVIKPVKHNTLKKELIKRIQKHKEQEKIETKKTLDRNKKNDVMEKIIEGGAKNDVKSEFEGAINYLTLLQQQNSRSSDANRKKTYNRTLKSIRPKQTSTEPLVGGSNNDVQANIDLPIELKSELPTNLGSEPSIHSSQLNLNRQPLQAAPPYSNLKQSPSGKPSYRQWAGTRKVRPTITPVAAAVEMPETPFSLETSEREQKLKKIQERTKTQNHIVHQNKEEIKKNIVNTDPPIKELDRHYKAVKSKLLGGKKNKKRVTKKTVKQKYTVGKSKLKKKVSVLVKDLKTRKKIYDAKKELTRTPINEVKEFLKKQGFLKAGSLAPNNVLREMYESIMMAGDVTNINGNIQLHNYIMDSEDNI